MSTRILHCSNSAENYNICIEQRVAGFSHRGPQPDDLIYLVVKDGKKTVCGARFKLDELTDFKPWPDGAKYVHTLRIKDIEYCQPFDISILSQTGGQSWSLTYIQGSKAISDQAALEMLSLTFKANKTDKFTPLEATEIHPQKPPESEPVEAVPVMRDSFRVQALLTDIGERMGYKIWLPRNDRGRVMELCKSNSGAVLEGLPLNYDIDTIITIENIDVLWIKGRTIVRAFEIEHTTSIYSGILRMADLMALQPNLSIKAHIVAPVERKAKVMQELSRPVFKHTLAPFCSFISYDSIEELAQDKKLKYMSDAVLGAFSESAVDTIA